MAVITPTAVQDADGRIVTYKWEGFTANGDVGQSIALGLFADRTAHTMGTFGVGGTLTWQGTLDDGSTLATWFTLNDPAMTPLSSTVATGKAVLEATRYIRPACTAGSSTIDIDAHLFLRKNPI